MSTAPQHCPGPHELDDLDLMAVGVLAPRVNAPGSTVTLDLPAGVRDEAAAAGVVELTDPEGAPIARVTWPAGEVTTLGRVEHGPFRRLRLAPEQAHGVFAGRPVLVARTPLDAEQSALVREEGAAVLAIVGHGVARPGAVAVLRSCLEATPWVVAVPLAAHPEVEDEVLAAYVDPDRVLTAPSAAEEGSVDDAVADGPPEGGLVVLFTGLSGSGKSTLARALTDHLLEQGRSVTSLDGDVVRRHLSTGLGFSVADRETNVRRIGWVAAQIAHHGGVAVCSPIAPFARTRAEVRSMTHDAGARFVLVHVSTPLAECERRDRKGLYAKARAGEIPEFTGISSPYEEPDDADVVVDTTGRSVDDALADVLAAL